MKIHECMTKDVEMLRPENTLQDAARLMAECDVGSIPINDGDRLVGRPTWPRHWRY